MRLNDPADVDDIRVLRREYVAWLGIAHIATELETELARLPGRYAPPAGALLLARDPNGTALGCIGVRPFDRPGACEIKHLYVRSQARGAGLGHELVNAAVAAAEAAGYPEALLDVLSTMEAAISIYRNAGFIETAPYWGNPVPQARFFAKPLMC